MSMYTGKVEVNISVVIFKPDGTILETLAINPYTNKPFQTVEEAEQVLEKRVAELNGTTTSNLSLSIYVIDSNGNKITNGKVGQEVQLVVESSVTDLPPVLYIPIKNQLTGNVRIVSVTKQETESKWLSEKFPFTVSGLFNIDETLFTSVNILPDTIDVNELNINATDVIVADI